MNCPNYIMMPDLYSDLPDGRYIWRGDKGLISYGTVNHHMSGDGSPRVVWDPPFPVTTPLLKADAIRMERIA